MIKLGWHPERTLYVTRDGTEVFSRTLKLQEWAEIAVSEGDRVPTFRQFIPKDLSRIP